MRTLVVGNWKMNETATQAARLAREIVDVLSMPPYRAKRSVDVVLAPPFTSLAPVRDAIAEHDVALGAQNVYWADSGAFTGEISPPMLLDLGVRYVIVGHSERRRYFGETDEDVRKKTQAALAHGLRPIVAVGETGDERDSGKTDERVTVQTRAALEGVTRERLSEIVIAYEPVWAIGTGRNCDPTEAARVIDVIRASVAGLDDVPVLYGGSVSPANFAQYMAMPRCCGGLVGGASLDAQSFALLVRIAGEARP